MIPISGLFYIFEAIIGFCITYKLWQSYQKTKISIHRNFVYLFLCLTLSFFLLGLPSFVVPQFPFILKTAYLIALALIFLGLAFGIKSLISIKLKRISPLIGLALTLIFGFIIVLLETFHFGQPKLIQGIIVWNLEPTATLMFSFLILALGIPLTIEFVRYGLKNPEIRARCLWLAAAFFLTGIGGCITHLNVTWLMLVLGHIAMSFGFISGAIAFIFTKPAIA